MKKKQVCELLVRSEKETRDTEDALLFVAISLGISSNQCLCFVFILILEMGLMKNDDVV